MHRAVIIKTTPPWLVGDITASGGDCPGARTGVVESINRALRDRDSVQKGIDEHVKVYQSSSPWQIYSDRSTACTS
jgi:hypothetical protein